MVAHAFNLRTQKAEVVQVQPGLQSKFYNSRGYGDKLCLKNPKTNNFVSVYEFLKPTNVSKHTFVFLRLSSFA